MKGALCDEEEWNSICALLLGVTTLTIQPHMSYYYTRARNRVDHFSGWTENRSLDPRI